MCRRGVNIPGFWGVWREAHPVGRASILRLDPCPGPGEDVVEFGKCDGHDSDGGGLGETACMASIKRSRLTVQLDPSLLQMAVTTSRPNAARVKTKVAAGKSKTTVPLMT